MRRLRILLFVVLSALVLSSCTLVSPNAKPVRIPKSKVGLDLLKPTIPGTNNARVRFTTQIVYIVDATGQLAPSSRIVPTPPALTTVIQQLLLGPSTIERLVGDTSALPQKLVLVSAEFHSGIGYLNFATPLSSLSPANQLLAVGQLVLTSTAVGATKNIVVKGIVIKVAGVVEPLLTPSGHRLRLVNKADFQSLLNP